MTEPVVKYKRHDFGDLTDVLLDGERVGIVRKRTEWYGNLGHRGVRYTYWDFYLPSGRDGFGATGEKIAQGGSSRKKVVAEALVYLGRVDAARIVERDTADHYASRFAEEKS